SSAAPTRYQTMWVMTGVRWSGMTTTSSPLARVKLDTSGPNPVAVCPLDPARMENETAVSATAARFMAWRKAGLLASSLTPAADGDPRLPAQEPAEYGPIAAHHLLVRVDPPLLTLGGIELLDFLPLDPLGHAIGLIRRWRLVAGRGLGQHLPRWLAGKRPG